MQRRDRRDEPATATRPSTPAATDPAGPGAAGLGFVPRRRMTRWLDVRVLVLTAVAMRRVGADGLRRDALAPPPEPCLRLAGEQEAWFDFVADLGDAFDPTMAVAWHLGRRSLTVVDDGGDPRTLPRGDLLVMGGDEVYPYASTARYRNQTVGPYAAGFEGDGEAALLALPGNHDWYGGIGPFVATFASGARIGGWQTHQDATWFAVELPHGWHLWGIDTAISGTVNDAQRSYFEQLAAGFDGSERIVLCTPVPQWVLRDRHADHLAALEDFRRTVIGDRARVPLHLAGDTHFLAAADLGPADAPELHVTSGGGGAFLHPTHHFASRPVDPDSRLAPRFVWPDGAVSRDLARSWWRVLVDRQILSLLAVIGALLFVGCRYPVPVAAVAAVAGVLVVRPNTPRPDARARAVRATGVGLGLALAAVVLLTALVARSGAPWADGGAIALAWVTACAVVGAAVAGAVLFSITAEANCAFDTGDNLVFSARHLARYEHFLRCHVDRDGTLTVYAIGIEDPGTGWDAVAAARGDERPAGCTEPQLLARWTVR